KSRNIGALVVVGEDGATILGIVSERDVVRALIEHDTHVLSLPVSRVMTTRVFTCTPSDRITVVMALMTRHRARHLPVVENGRLAGIVSIGDVVKNRIDELELEANTLRETLMVGHWKAGRVITVKPTGLPGTSWPCPPPGRSSSPRCSGWRRGNWRDARPKRARPEARGATRRDRPAPAARSGARAPPRECPRTRRTARWDQSC